MAIQAKELGFRRLLLPAANAQEGAVVQGLEIYPVAHISQLVEHLSGRHPLAPVHPLPLALSPLRLFRIFPMSEGNPMRNELWKSQPAAAIMRC